jgi:DNA-binding CsgD family transcriptional regulator
MGAINLGASSYALSEGAGWLVATIAITALALVLLNMKTERMARNCYHALLLLLVASALLLPAAFLHGETFASAATAVNSATYSCFSMLIWVVVVSFAARHSNASIRIIATARAGWATGPLAGMLLGRYVLHVAGVDAHSVLLTTFVAVMAVLIGMCFVFSETDLARCMDVLPMRRKRRFRDKCLRVAREGALSERETEVMVLLAKGLSLAYIQEHLLMSKSTASTHRQHIYRKLGIHSQQELIEKVEAVAGD